MIHETFTVMDTGGGDVKRKKKLLPEKQQATGKVVTLSQAAFRAVISRSGLGSS